MRGEECWNLVIYHDGLAVAGDLSQFGEHVLADGIRQDGVTEVGGSLLGSPDRSAPTSGTRGVSGL